jgi:hypothetical protein
MTDESLLTRKRDALPKFSNGEPMFKPDEFSASSQAFDHSHLTNSSSVRRVAIWSSLFAAKAACRKRTSTLPAINQQNCVEVSIEILGSERKGQTEQNESKSVMS